MTRGHQTGGGVRGPSPDGFSDLSVPGHRPSGLLGVPGSHWSAFIKPDFRPVATPDFAFPFKSFHIHHELLRFPFPVENGWFWIVRTAFGDLLQGTLTGQEAGTPDSPQESRRSHASVSPSERDLTSSEPGTRRSFLKAEISKVVPVGSPLTLAGT